MLKPHTVLVMGDVAQLFRLMPITHSGGDQSVDGDRRPLGDLEGGIARSFSANETGQAQIACLGTGAASRFPRNVTATTMCGPPCGCTNIPMGVVN